MGTIKKKWLKMILPVLLVVSMVMSQIGPLTIINADEPNGTITATLEDGVLTINGADGATVNATMINSAIPGFNTADVKEICFTGDVIGIGAEAFQYYANLEKVTIPATVKTVGFYAFKMCSNLHEIILEESSEPIKLDGCSFQGCFGVEGTIDWSGRPITSIPESGTNGSEGILKECTMLTEATVKVADYLDTNAFKDCTGLKKVTIIPDEDLSTVYIGDPEYITTTNVDTFVNCTSLEEVIVDAEEPTVLHIGVSAFSQLKNLTTIKSADDTKVTMMVETGAFYDCDGLVDILPISGGTRSVAGRMGVFEGCDGLKYVEFADGCTTVTSNMFQSCKSLETVKFSDTIEKIEHHAFAYCFALKDVYLSANLNTMEKDCFRECTSLTEIDIPGGVKVIPQNAFCQSGLEKVTYGDVEVFEDSAFSGTFLKEFRIPASTTKVDMGAFAIDVDAGVIRGYVEATDPVACWVRDLTFGDSRYYTGDMRLYLSVPRVDDANDAFPPFSTENDGEHAWYLYKDRFRAGWAINVNDGIENGTVTSVRMAEEGETDVPIYVMPDFGYSVKELLFTDADGNALEVATTTVQRNREYMFTMPGEPVYITVIFENAPTYTIDYNDDLANGKITVTVNGEVVEEGSEIPIDTEVTLTVTADKDYVLNEFSVTDSNGDPVVMDENNTFLMPESNLSVNAIFVQNHSCGCIDDETAIWKPFNSVATEDSYGSWDIKEPGYYVLTEDIKVEGYGALGIGGTGKIYLCLNGHTIESSGEYTIKTGNADITICDCGDGEIKNTSTGAEYAVYNMHGHLTLIDVKITAQSGPALYVGQSDGTVTIKSSELKSYADSTKWTDYDGYERYGGHALFFDAKSGTIIAEDSKFISENNHAIYYDATYDNNSSGWDPNKKIESKFTNCRVVSKKGNAMVIEDCALYSTITIEGGIYKAIGGVAICEDTNRQNILNLTDVTLMSDDYAMQFLGTEVLKLKGNVVFDGAKGGMKFTDDGKQNEFNFDASEYTGKKIKIELCEGTTPTDYNTPAPVFAPTENDYSKYLAYTTDNWGITHDGTRHYAVIRQIITQPTNDEIDADGYKFSITVSEPNDARYQWYKLPAGILDENAVPIEGATGTTFETTEKGFYVCEVTWVDENGETYFKLYSNTCIAGAARTIRINQIDGYTNYKFNGSLVPVGTNFYILEGEEFDFYFEVAPTHRLVSSVDISKLTADTLFQKNTNLVRTIGEVTQSGNGYVFKCTISYAQGVTSSTFIAMNRNYVEPYNRNSAQNKNLSDVLRGEVLHTDDKVTNDLEYTVKFIALNGKGKVENVKEEFNPGDTVTIGNHYADTSSYFWKVWDKPNTGSYDNTYGDSENNLVTLIGRDSALQVNPDIKVEADDSKFKNYTVSGMKDGYSYYYSLTPIENDIEDQKTLFNSEAEIRYVYDIVESELENLIELPKDGKVSVDNKYMIHVYAVKETLYGCTVYGEYMDSIGKTPLICNITDNSEIKNATVSIDKIADIADDETVTVVVVADENYEFVAEPVINIEGAVATLKDFRGTTIVIAVDGFTAENVVIDIDAETKRTAKSILAEVKPIVEALIAEYTATNDTTAEELQKLVNEAIADYIALGVVAEVTISDKQDATYHASGSLTGNVGLSCEDETDGVEISKEIAQMDMPIPVIVTNPENITVIDGSSAQFVVVVDGIEVSYQWQVDKNDGNGFVNLDGETTDSYTVSETFMSFNGYKYQCIITNNGGSVTTTPATLTVVKKASYKVSELTRGDTVQFRDSLLNDLDSDVTVYITDISGNVISVTLSNGEVFDIVEEYTDADVVLGAVTWDIRDCPASGSYDNVYGGSDNKVVVLIPTGSEKQTAPEITVTAKDDKLKDYVVSGMKDGYKYYYSLILADDTAEAQKTLFNKEDTIRYVYYMNEASLGELIELPADGAVTVDNKYMIHVYAVAEGNLLVAEYMDCIGKVPVFYSITDKSEIDNATVSIDKSTDIAEDEAITVTIVTDENYEFATAPVINISTGAVAELIESGKTSITIKVYDFTADATIDVDVTTKKTAKALVADVKPIIEAVIAGYTATNDTTTEEIQKLVNDAIADYIALGVEAVVIITDNQDATYTAAGKVIGSVEINCEDVNDEVAINKEIAQLVMDKPVIIVDVVDSTVTEGDQVKFVVEATGMDLSYQWQVNKNDGNGFVNITGETNATYTISAADVSNNGYKYQCVVSNLGGSVTSSQATLTVKEKAPAHTHSMTKVAANAATCTQDGNKEYYVCDICDGVFADENGITATTLDEVKIAAHGHDWSGEWIVIKDATETEEGKKATFCLNDCGQKKVVEIQPLGKPDVNSNFDKHAEVAPGAPIDEVTLDNNKEELLQSGNIFTEDEKQQSEAGVDSEVWLEVTPTDEDKIIPADKNKFEQIASNIMGNNVNITYFDADLFKRVGNSDAILVPEPGVSIKITIVIPSQLLNKDNTVVREFKILRLHNGQVDVISGDFNPETSEFSFESDKFSTYAIVYADAPVDDGDENETEPGTEGDNNETESETEGDNNETESGTEGDNNNPDDDDDDVIDVPNTGDFGILWFLIIFMLIGGVCFTCYVRKKAA